jgi:hypothetical protein
MPTIIARTIVALTFAALVLTGCAPAVSAPAAPMPTAVPAVAADYAAWVACVDAAWAADDPSDATLQACDARHGSHWTYPGGA